MERSKMQTEEQRLRKRQRGYLDKLARNERADNPTYSKELEGKIAAIDARLDVIIAEETQK